ncbi:Gfo/Idh/MocA family oxidoreductase [Rhodobacteraceae bacterium NNCM2]|nr:Gfo/Idh/MocA family oxidoreductase [Coraliihabitans acroporae]
MSLRVACIGAGYFSQFHYDAWSRIDDVALVGACDLHAKTLEAHAPGVPHFDDARSMLTQVSPDLVDIITPPPSHFGLIKQAIEAGTKAIICQKPFCQTLDEAEAATALAEHAGVVLAIHENFRFQPWYRQIARMISDGAFGEVMQITFRLRPGDGQGPEAYLDRQPYFQQMPRFLIHETGVHWVDTFRFLLGEPETVWADLRQINPAIKGEDAGIVVFGYPNGARAVFDGNRLSDHPASNRRRTMGECLIEGTKMAALLDGDGRIHTRPFGSNDWTDTGLVAPETGFGGDCVHALQAHVVAALAEGRPPENSARDYLSVIRTELAIYESNDSGRRIPL